EETYEPPRPQPAPTYHAIKEPETKKPPVLPNITEHQQSLEYRMECLAKHLGGASVLLKEAYQRANDEGIGDGTAEKIVAAMNEHSGMEDDLDKMAGMSDIKPAVDKILSGERAFRAAAWKAKLPIGGGTKEDIADARVWNDLMLAEVLAQARAHPGTQCILEGM
ncbi:MAG: hypothetical protein KJ820_16315, partial [Bacteroidetes bacterium]|nr:hypothetical protein [Bacteroidota bacterium]